MMISAAEAAAAALSPPLARGIVLSPSLLELQVTDGESIEGTPPLSVAVQRLTRLRKHLRTVVDPKKDALNQARMLDLDVVDDETASNDPPLVRANANPTGRDGCHYKY